jgi:hypothetical protein
MKNLGKTSEQGSALILALFCIVLLTLIGLTLALITSGETGIAGNETQVNRTFYAAESAVNTGTTWAVENMLAFQGMAQSGVANPTSPFTDGVTPTKNIVRTTVPGRADDPFNPNQLTIAVSMPAPIALAYSNARDYGLNEHFRDYVYRIQSTATDTGTVLTASPNLNPPSHTVSQNLQMVVKEHIF